MYPSDYTDEKEQRTNKYTIAKYVSFNVTHKLIVIRFRI